jgi:multidrug efflux pump subunit AcrA (membrane-fusion protein)
VCRVQEEIQLSAIREVVLVAALLLGLAWSATAQTGYGRIGPSNGAIVGAAVGVAAATGVVLYLTLHKPSITGCVRSVDGIDTVTDEKDKGNYTVVDGDSQLKPGDRVKLQGKKRKDKSGNRTFQVKKFKRDYGPCQP